MGALDGENALWRVGQGAVEPLSRDEAENGVAEDFEALVIDRVWAEEYLWKSKTYTANIFNVHKFAPIPDNCQKGVFLFV